MRRGPGEDKLLGELLSMHKEMGCTNTTYLDTVRFLVVTESIIDM